MRTVMRFAVLLTLLMLLPAVAQSEEKFYESEGLKLRYWDEGEGEPLLLIHGSGATGTLNWRAPGIQQRLSQSHRVIMPDVRGHGRSETPEDNTYGIAVVHDMIALMDLLEIESAHVVGYSMGGMITIKLTTMFPKRVRSAVVGGMGWIDADNEAELRFGSSSDDSRFSHSVRAFGEFGTTADEMRAIEAPMKVIVGTKDPGQMRRVSLWKEIVPTLDVTYIEDATHQGCVFHDDLRDGIVRFVRRHTEQAHAAN